MSLYYSLALAASFVSIFLFTPLARNIAIKVSFIDYPKQGRFHKEPIPYLGGLAFVMSFLVALFISYRPMWELSLVLASGLVVSAMGLADDYTGRMRPLFKISVQCLSGFAMYSMGIKVDFFPYEVLNLALTLFWIVGITNAFNLIDNMDGVCAGIAGISAFFFFIFSALQGQYLVAIMSAALAGGCFGFLKFNFNPASIFMGDSGSYFLGLLLSVIGLKLRLENPHSIFAIAVPGLILSVPIFDTFLVTFDRIRRRRPIWQGGVDHSTHRVRILVGSDKLTAVIFYLVSVTMGCLSLLVGFTVTSLLAFGLMMVVVGLLATVAFLVLLKVQVHKP